MVAPGAFQSPQNLGRLKYARGSGRRAGGAFQQEPKGTVFLEICISGRVRKFKIYASFHICLLFNVIFQRQRFACVRGATIAVVRTTQYERYYQLNAFIYYIIFFLHWQRFACVRGATIAVEARRRLQLQLVTGMAHLK